MGFCYVYSMAKSAKNYQFIVKIFKNYHYGSMSEKVKDNFLYNNGVHQWFTRSTKFGKGMWLTVSSWISVILCLWSFNVFSCNLFRCDLQYSTVHFRVSSRIDYNLFNRISQKWIVKSNKVDQKCFSFKLEFWITERGDCDKTFYLINYIENFPSRQFEILTLQLHHGNLNTSLMKMIELNYSFFFSVSIHKNCRRTHNWNLLCRWQLDVWT
jgi:hypothetical protein